MTDREKWSNAQDYLYKRLKRAKLALARAEVKSAPQSEIEALETKIGVLDYLIGLLYSKEVGL